MTPRRKLHVIACPSLRPELEALSAQCQSEISTSYLAMALHDLNADALRQSLQTAIDASATCDAIAIGYGQCNRGVVGLSAREIPLVLPRALDCIGMLLGSNTRYIDSLEDEPGTFFQSAGWLAAALEVAQEQFTFGPNSNVRFDLLATRYGADAATYLMQELDAFTKHYKRLTYIVTDIAASTESEHEARQIAARRGLEYHRLEGNTGWLRRLLDGIWCESEFLIVRPGHGVVLADGNRLMEGA